MAPIAPLRERMGPIRDCSHPPAQKDKPHFTGYCDHCYKRLSCPVFAGKLPLRLSKQGEKTVRSKGKKLCGLLRFMPKAAIMKGRYTEKRRIYMYLDPGFAQMVIQVVVAAVAAGGAYLLLFRNKVRSLFKKNKKADAADAQPSKDEAGQ